MDRTIISWNIPNLITIPVMAALGFLLIAVVWQVLGRFVMGGGSAPAEEGGY